MIVSLVTCLGLWIRRCVPLAFAFMLFAPVHVAGAAEESAPATMPPATDSPAAVMSEFNKVEVKDSDIVAITDQKKRVVMFLMGVPLLTFIVITVVLGIAMGVYGKRVYVPHMVFAGLSVTLAIAHAVVGIVWFYPF